MDVDELEDVLILPSQYASRPYRALAVIAFIVIAASLYAVLNKVYLIGLALFLLSFVIIGAILTKDDTSLLGLFFPIPQIGHPFRAHLSADKDIEE